MAERTRSGEQVTGIEPVIPAWQPSVSPQHFTCRETARDRAGESRGAEDGNRTRDPGTADRCVTSTLHLRGAGGRGAGRRLAPRLGGDRRPSRSEGGACVRSIDPSSSVARRGRRPAPVPGERPAATGGPSLIALGGASWPPSAREPPVAGLARGPTRRGCTGDPTWMRWAVGRAGLVAAGACRRFSVVKERARPRMARGRTDPESSAGHSRAGIRDGDTLSRTRES